MDTPLSVALELTGAAVVLSDLRLGLPSDADPFALPDPAVVGRRITELGALITTMGDAYLRRSAEPAQQGFPAEAFAIALNRAGQTVSALGTVGQQLSALATMPTGPSGLPGSDYTRTLAATCIGEALQAAHQHLQDGVRVLRDAASDTLPAPEQAQQAVLARSPHTATAGPPTPAPTQPAPSSGPAPAAPDDLLPPTPGSAMINEDAFPYHYAKWLRTTADEIAVVRTDLPRSFNSAYGNGGPVSVSDLTEAAGRVGHYHREALTEADFHSQGLQAQEYSAFLTRAWTSSAADLVQANLDLTRAADAAAAFADARTRAPDAAPVVEEQTRAGVDRLLYDAQAALDRAVETLRSNADSLAGGRPLPAPAAAEHLASTRKLQQDPTAARRAAALTRSTTPASATDPQHPAPSTPETAPSSARGRR
ncbi:hypothetical protein [Kitasatospora sp. NPDC057198]|uniref:hypothetical protein n=1 Tax=Kitasatospora sp. NPDC057198 TaxID=3346046 RepID=UPI003626BBAF